MKNTQTITIHYEESEKEVILNYAPADSTWVNCNTLLKDFPSGCLVEGKHKFLQTQFILDNTESCKLIVFDVKKEFVSIKTHNHTGDAPFSFLISDHYVVLLPDNNSLATKDIRSLEIINSDKH